jgi:CheY-like chemotaxis protein
VFDPFFTTKPVGLGTGLGLAQVYGIIKQHSGAIDVASQVEDGTTFTIYLPAISAAQENGLIDRPASNLVGRGETVLVVEDDQAAREALQTLLESRNYNVEIAKNGLEALEIYKKDGAAIDLVISDVMMPQMGGVALYRELRKLEWEIKFLFITGHPMDIENQTLLQTGRVQWLQKPFNVQELSLVLNTMLGDTK